MLAHPSPCNADVFVANYVIDGAKFDIAKSISPNFQVTHRFGLGQANPQNYSFGSFLASNRVRPFSVSWRIFLG